VSRIGYLHFKGAWQLISVLDGHGRGHDEEVR
jgi:hypothetical protein